MVDDDRGLIAKLQEQHENTYGTRPSAEDLVDKDEVAFREAQFEGYDQKNWSNWPIYRPDEDDPFLQITLGFFKNYL